MTVHRAKCFDSKKMLKIIHLLKSEVKNSVIWPNSSWFVCGTCDYFQNWNRMVTSHILASAVVSIRLLLEFLCGF